MKIFLDTADLKELEQGFASGMVDGVTTNPSLIKAILQKQGGKATAASIEQYLNTILKLAGKTPVSLEVKGGTAEEMYQQGKAIYKRFSKPSNHVVIKVPFNPTTDLNKPAHMEGLKAIKKFSSEGIPVNVTLIFTPEQALLAAKAGAAYVSPFVGRIDDKIRTENKIVFKKDDYFPGFGWKATERKNGKNGGEDYLNDNGIVSGVDVIHRIVYIFGLYDIKTEVLAASIRNARQLREVALMGADIATIPLKVLEEATQHSKSVEGMKAFLADTVPEYEALMK